MPRAATVLPALAAIVLMPGAVGAAFAAPSTSSPQGVDVSYPQCGRPLPTGHAFAIIGVNGGRPTTTNPCLATELAWAAEASGGTVHDDIQLYVNTGNPGGQSAVWPQSGRNHHGTCDGSNSRACAYQYGWERARDDATIRGIRNPKQYMWWLDVETVNSWDHTVGGGTRNAAVLEGMTEYFTAIGVRGVGLYSTRYQWGEIVGDGVDATSSLNGLSNWRPTGSTREVAVANCGLEPLTPGGIVEMTQYTMDFDYIHSCI
ncbi:MAG: hypothetical protein JWQ37_108 [Blastococcus sp.]|nr:hypothetical protein [Blastococcus sp.]